MPLPAAIATLNLQTPRLQLRGVETADLDALHAVNGDPEVTRFLPYDTWRSAADGEAWLARMQALQQTGTGTQLVVVRREDARAVGTVLLFRFDEGSARLELGYVLARACWGQGVMREALQALCAHVLGPGGVRRIEAEVNPRNDASAQLLQRLGFTREGRARQRWVAKGEAYDTDLYGLLVSEWPPAAR